ncbi:WD repeat-containing protein 36 [Lycorma delicatula]|uniref:WD repeat-containing protein 36 n=1 Tax=Lycorma delicatula TaxID=130591 RepID=UPI003F518E9C
MSGSSKIFSSSRALGYVSNHIPLVTRFINRRGENLIVTCVGKSFHTYGCSHFTLLSVSGLLSDEITSLAADTYHIYTASRSDIHAWRRGTELKHTYKGHNFSVHLLLSFGPHLLSVDENNTLIVWDIKTEEIYLELKFSNETFHVTTLMHPSTYVNKILMGSEQGQLQLWNVKTSKLIYTFRGWNSPVTALVQATAVDVVGVGLSNGRIILHNLKFDETIMSFMQDWGAVTTISFRLDGAPVMSTGSPSGHIVLWDLEKKSVLSQLINAHHGAVTGMHCLPSEPLMVTSSPDNSLKLWIFDMPDGGARLLRLREGHAAPPTWIRFHGTDGHNILSAGKDSSLRIFSTISETFNKSMGRAFYRKKGSKKKGKIKDNQVMPPIVNFVSEVTRDKEWDSIAAIHHGLAVVTTWSYDKIKMGDMRLIPEKLKNYPNSYVRPTATCLYLTNCGNFVIVGYNTGHVERFNIQSGIHRCSYGVKQAHDDTVRGVTADNLNQIVISAGADKIVKVWYFKVSDKPPIEKIPLDEPVNFFHAHKDSSVICIVLEDFTVLLLDLDTRKIVRKFSGHSSVITDATFSPDARWLVTASMDQTIRTWDIPSGQLVDCFQVPAVCTSLSFSPTGEYLATSHVDYLGVFLWSNRTLFTHVSLRPLSIDAVVPLIELPYSCPTERCPDLEESNKEQEFLSLDQISENLITLSGLANSRWQNLLDIDIIKKRNKPKEPPKAPKAAPFFLPTIPSMNLQFDFSTIEKTDGVKTLHLDNLKNNLTVFGKILEQCGISENFNVAIDKLKTMGSSGIDMEINSLSIEGGGSITLMYYFMKMVLHMLKNYKDFELGQAYLALFLKVHGEVVALTPKLNSFLSDLQIAQGVGWNRLEDQFLFSLSVVDSLKIS